MVHCRINILCYYTVRDTEKTETMPCKICSGECLEWQSLCYECFAVAASTAEKRQCMDCKEYNLLSIEPAWRTRCKECYAEAQANARKCQTCSTGTLPMSAPKWRKMCGGCFKDSRAKTHDECPTCTGARYGKLTKRKEQKQCSNCLVAIKATA